MAAHEMRTPLAAIQASSELLARYPLEEARRLAKTGRVRAAIKRELIRKIEAGR